MKLIEALPTDKKTRYLLPRIPLSVRYVLHRPLSRFHKRQMGFHRYRHHGTSENKKSYLLILRV